MTAMRLLFAQGREGMIPAFFSSVNPKTGSPGKAVIAVAIFNCVGILLGNGLLEPIVNIMSICVAAIYVLICAATLVTRRRAPGHYVLRGWAGNPHGFEIGSASGGGRRGCWV